MLSSLMLTPVLMAILGGVLIGLSRQLNGRLAVSTSAMMASFWNHLVGFALLTVLGISGVFILTPDISGLSLWVWLGGPVGVIFIAAGSWLIVRIGAVNTAMMVIAGQMIWGVVFDLLQGANRTPWLDGLGVVMIFIGLWLTVFKRA